MSLALIILIVVAGLYVGWNIGSNDSGNCIGPTIGAGLIRYRTGIILVAAFAVGGALVQGGGVVKTMGKGIVPEALPPLGVLAALLSGGFFVSIATFKKIPVSTSQAIVGGVAGVGLAAQLTVDFSKVITIVQCWILCPIMSGFLAFWILRLTRAVTRRVKDQRRTRRVLSALVLMSSCYAAWALGANNLGIAIGPIVALDMMSILVMTLLGTASIALGALTFGRGIAETIGKSITKLNLKSAFAAQVAAGMGLHVFSMIGIPVSSSQATVGAVLGVGMVHGIRAISKRKIMEIVIGWIATPMVSGVTAFGVYWLILRITL